VCVSVRSFERESDCVCKCVGVCECVGVSVTVLV